MSLVRLRLHNLPCRISYGGRIGLRVVFEKLYYAYPPKKLRAFRSLPSSDNRRTTVAKLMFESGREGPKAIFQLPFRK